LHFGAKKIEVRSNRPSTDSNFSFLFWKNHLLSLQLIIQLEESFVEFTYDIIGWNFCYCFAEKKFVVDTNCVGWSSTHFFAIWLSFFLDYLIMTNSSSMLCLRIKVYNISKMKTPYIIFNLN
jgi:hypothetical protein